MSNKRKNTEIYSDIDKNPLFKLSFSYLYGALFHENNIIFINKDKYFYYKTETEDKINIENKENKDDLKQIFYNRLYHIYNNNIINPTIFFNFNFNLKKIIYGGVNTIKLPIYNETTKNSDLIYFKLKKEDNDYNNLFRLPDDTYNLEYFLEELTKSSNGYMQTTRDYKEVYGIFLCFFHIDNFEITDTFREYPMNEYLNPKNLIIPRKKNCSGVNIQKCQEYVYATKVIETASQIYNIINKTDDKLYPVHVDIEYSFDKDTKELKRDFFLDDGNHRIYTLKRLGYNGLVPCICFDYLPINNIMK